jgi:hypothetical protein
MKASELIKVLAECINDYGDLEVESYDCGAVRVFSTLDDDDKVHLFIEEYNLEEG